MSAIDPKNIKFQAMSIHKLRAQKDDFNDQKSAEDFILKIIRIYNGKKIESHQSEHAYQPITLRNWRIEEHNGFYQGCK